MKTAVSKEKKCVFAKSTTMRKRNFRKSSRKQKKVREPFLSVHMGPRLNILRQKNGQQSRDTAPLIIIIVVYCLLSMVKNRINDRITNLITLMPKLLVITPNGMGLYIVHAVQ